MAQTTAAYSAFIDHACGLAKELADLYVMFRKEIDPDADNNLKAVPRKQRGAMVRKGIRAGLVGEIDQELGRLYRAYSESVRRNYDNLLIN